MLYECKTCYGVYKLRLELGGMWILYVTVGPVVDVASDLVYTGPGQSPTIKCIVESNPKAIVAWYHNSSTAIIDFDLRSNVHSSQLFIDFKNEW